MIDENRLREIKERSDIRDSELKELLKLARWGLWAWHYGVPTLEDATGKYEKWLDEFGQRQITEADSSIRATKALESFKRLSLES